jgi:hypothetical protein
LKLYQIHGSRNKLFHFPSPAEQDFPVPFPLLTFVPALFAFVPTLFAFVPALLIFVLPLFGFMLPLFDFAFQPGFVARLAVEDEFDRPVAFFWCHRR